jgi:hypothetical protein
VDQNSPNLGKTSRAPAPLVRVLVVDDHPLLREGVAAVLTGKSDLAIVGEASDGREAIEKFRALQPDVTVMDLQMPLMSGIDAMHAIRLEALHSTLNETERLGVRHRLSARLRGEFGKDALGMRFDGLWCDVQTLSDPFVGKSVGDEAQNITLAGCERLTYDFRRPPYAVREHLRP